MAKKAKQTIAFLLSVIMLISVFPITNVFAANVVDSGTCGDNVYWSLDSEGTLTIAGIGNMYAYYSSEDVPWDNYRDAIQMIDIKQGVRSVCNCAFKDCKNITDVTIPNSVAIIGNYAFDACFSLTNVVIPDSVISIGLGAFFACFGLTDIVIPDSVTNIEDMAFTYCTNLNNITVVGNNPSFSSDDGVLFNKDKTTLIQYPIGNARTEYIVPDSVTRIEDQAFSMCTNITSVTIPDSVESIGFIAFYNCTGLTSITIPESVSLIESGAFQGCGTLADVYYAGTADEWNCINIDEGNDELLNANIHFNYTTIIASGICGDNLTWTLNSNGKLIITGTGDMYNYGSGNGYAPWYSNYKSIKTVDIKNGVTSIGDEAFYDCGKLKSVTIPSSATSIGDGAFMHCLSLINIVIPNGVTSIGDSAFSNCLGLTSITIPDSVTYIGDFAFTNCTNLANITISAGVTFIGEAVFVNCESLANITVDANNQNYSSIDGVLFNKNKTKLIYYPAGKSTEYYTIPNGVTSIGTYAFYICNSLTSVTIPDSVTSIDAAAFPYCISLKSITIPDSVTIIGDYAFEGCFSLESINIPDSVIRIGDLAFYQCISLAEATIPNSVTSIGESSFVQCLSLKKINIPENIESIGKSALAECCSLKNISVKNPNIDLSESGIGLGELILTVPLEVFVEAYKKVIYGTATEEEIEAYESMYEYLGGMTPMDGVTIYGYENSTAQAYAYEYGFNFVPFESSHEHSYVAVITTPATCETDGVKTFTCVCGDSYTETIPAFGHDFEHIVEPSTCTVNGVEYDFCYNCLKTFNYNVLALAPHNYGEWTVNSPATCKAAGEKSRVCVNEGCGHVDVAVIPVDSENHVGGTEVRNAKAATCTENGYTGDTYCLGCNAKLASGKIIVAPGHNYGEWGVVTAPTVVKEGMEERECLVCGYVEEREIPMLEALVAESDDGEVAIYYTENEYDMDITVEATQKFDGTSYQILNAQKGNFKKVLYDVNVMSDGVKVQPNSTVWVRIPVPAGYNEDTIIVYYVTNDGTLEEMESEIRDGYIFFAANHFSDYAIVDESGDAEDNCSCSCHKSGIVNFFWKIANFFHKLFGMSKYRYCSCGRDHWTK